MNRSDHTQNDRQPRATQTKVELRKSAKAVYAYSQATASAHSPQSKLQY